MPDKPAGKCPYCGYTDINYHDIEQEDTKFDYLCTCNSCGKHFRECYDLIFVGIYDEKGEKEL